ncbi:MAG: Serine/threonine-protein kinase BtrW [Planctomycetota bacterium]|jgi:serine/threonine-protein kinase RsbW
MADNPSDPWLRTLVLPSERGTSRLVTEELLEQLGLFGWSQEDIFGIHLAAEEALVNAAVHGNKLDPSKRVHVECQVSTDLVRLTVTDEGPGFDPESVPDCTLAERLEVPSGRGVMLMRSFMTRVEYNAQGNSVVLEKRRGEPAAAAE